MGVREGEEERKGCRGEVRGGVLQGEEAVAGRRKGREREGYSGGRRGVVTGEVGRGGVCSEGSQGEGLKDEGRVVGMGVGGRRGHRERLQERLQGREGRQERRKAGEEEGRRGRVGGCSFFFNGWGGGGVGGVYKGGGTSRRGEGFLPERLHFLILIFLKGFLFYSIFDKGVFPGEELPGASHQGGSTRRGFAGRRGRYQGRTGFTVKEEVYQGFTTVYMVYRVAFRVIRGVQRRSGGRDGLRLHRFLEWSILATARGPEGWRAWNSGRLKH